MLFLVQADQSGTVTEILAEDGKPVSVDTVISPFISLRHKDNFFIFLF